MAFEIIKLTYLLTYLLTNAVKSCGMDVVDEFFGGGCSPCLDCAGQGNHFELIPTVKWKLDSPYRAILVVSFWRSVIFWSYGGLKSQELEKKCPLLAFFEKTIPYG